TDAENANIALRPGLAARLRRSGIRDGDLRNCVSFVESEALELQPDVQRVRVRRQMQTVGDSLQQGFSSVEHPITSSLAQLDAGPSGRDVDSMKAIPAGRSALRERAGRHQREKEPKDSAEGHLRAGAYALDASTYQ